MPPKKTRAQASSSQQADQPSQKQTRSASREPSAESQRQTRGGRKRRRSDASDTVEQPVQARSAIATPSKRRKRGKGAAQAQTEHERLQQVAEEQEEEDPIETSQAAEATDSIEVSQTKHAHFGTRGVHTDTLIPSDDHEATAFHITPYPRKMSIKRRVTVSPGVGDSDSKRIRTASVRHSLPPSLLQRGESQVKYFEERKFAPLSLVLPERMEKRNRIRELVQLLGQERLKNNIERVEEIENELDQLKEEQRGIIAAIDDDADVDGEDDMLVLASQEEIKYPELPEVPSPEILLRSSQTRSREDAWRVERERLQDLLLTLSKESTEATTKLQVFRCEIEALGFGDDGIGASAVVQSIRNSMNAVRDSLKEILLDDAPEEASNEDLLDLVVKLLKEYAGRLRAQDEELYKMSQLDADLTKQVQGLINRLADSESSRERLQKSWNDLDLQVDEERREIAALQVELDDATNERDLLQDELEAKTSEEQAQKEENADLGKNIDRLTATLQDYREKETNLTDLIGKMEDEYRVSVSKMNREREEAVRDLEDRLDVQTQLRTEVEEQAVECQATIRSLDHKIEEIETERDQLVDELAEMTARRDQEQDARESAEDDLQESSIKINELEERVTQLEDDLGTLDTQLTELRQMNEQERAQREAAEGDLDERDAELEELRLKLKNQGIEANELRLKLFEVQQQNERKILELEQTASERDEQYQVDIAQEVERREDADGLARQRAEAVTQLENHLEQVEQQMQISLVQRDKRIEELEQQLRQKDGELDRLQSDLLAARDLYDGHVQGANEQLQELEAHISGLRSTVSEQKEQISSMHEEAAALVDTHNSEIEDRNAHIARLNHAVAEYEVQVTDLTRERNGLERRVEQEAEQMLGLQNEKEDEIEALKATIRDKHGKMQSVQEKAIAADARWGELIGARDEEIETLRVKNEENMETITALTTGAEALRRKFREYVHQTNAKQKAAKNETVACLERVERIGVELEEDGEQVLREVDAMDVLEQATVVATTHHHTQERTSRKTRGRKRRVADSGIGLEGEDGSLVPE